MALCLTAGIVDVIGFLELGHVFTANMTGNIVMLGMALGQSQELAVLRAVIALLGFMAGNAVGAVLIRENASKLFWPRDVTVMIAVECVLLLLFGILFYFTGTSGSMVYVLIALLSGAMGMQTTAARKLGIAGISTTVLTNNLTHVVEDSVSLGRRLLRRDRSKEAAVLNPDSTLRAVAIAVYLLGAVVTALTFYMQWQFIIWVPSLLVVGVIALAFIRFHKAKM
ncbi:DUF1275 domain-containing protein [Paenibacillaceae bacterium]|nr:DUF1275 domain-containing protein [Paenibacillaceae bacterium]